MIVTDYHCHILPGLDDGARDLDESLIMARAACAAGFNVLIATPHFEEGVFENERGLILRKVEELNFALKKAHIAVTVHPGAEIMLSPGIPQLLEKGRLMTVGDEGTHLLIELSPTVLPLWVGATLDQIRQSGVIPVLAHPERYAWLPPIEKGAGQKKAEYQVMLQCNFGSLRGKYGLQARVLAERLNKLGLVDFWGSDAHSPREYMTLRRGWLAM